MPSKGKTKGNMGELKIAKFLTELFGAKFIRKSSCPVVPIIPQFYTNEILCMLE
jgi:hypothetical protein